MPSSRKRSLRKNRQTRNLNFEALEIRRLLTVNGPGVSDPALFDLVIDVPADTTSTSILAEIGEVAGETVQLNVADGGFVESNAEAFAGNEVNISGGEIGGNFSALSGSEVNISGGVVGNFSNAESDSKVNISGGEVGVAFAAESGSEVNISGGELGRGFDANSGSVVNISGGVVGSEFNANSGSEVNISGGEVGLQFEAFSGSEVNISGGVVGVRFDALSGSVVNVTGGEIGAASSAQSGSVVNVSGGEIGTFFNAEPNSVVNISGGSFGVGFDAEANSNVTISGGLFGSRFEAQTDSNVELIGGDFRLNGEIFGGSTITLTEGDVFSGVLQDGSGFIFSSQGADVLNDVTLTRVPLPAVNPVPVVVDTVFPDPLLAGQTITVVEGGSFPSIVEFVNSTVNIEDGFVSNLSAVLGSEINLVDGELGRNIDAFGSVVNISGGEVGPFLTAFSDSVVNISGGEVGSAFTASGSEVNISGGVVANNFDAESGSEVNISGGVVGNFFDAFVGSVVNISGGEIGEVPTASGSEINISGGVVGPAFNAESGSVVNISGGEVGNGFTASGSEVNFSGGEIGFASAESGSVFNISGGVVGNNFDASSGSVVNISRGVVGDLFDAESGSVVNISGGEIGERFDLFSGGEVNLFVTEYQIDGVPQNVAATGDAITITDRDVTLSGRLVDNTPFSFDLNSVDTVLSTAFFSPDGTLTVTLVGSVVNGVPSDVTVVENTASDLDLSSLSYSSFSPFGAGRVQVGLEVSEGILAATSNNDVTVRGSGTGELTLIGLVENLNTFFDDASNVQYTGPAGLSGEDAVTLTLTLDDDSPTITNEINIDITPLEEGPNIVGPGDVVNIIFGGELPESFVLLSGGEANLFVTEYQIDGVPQNVAATGDAIAITDRDVTLSGRLFDGTPFSFDLNSVENNVSDFFSPDGTLTVTLVGSTLDGVPTDVAVVENTTSDLDLSSLSVASFSPGGVGTVQVGLSVDAGTLSLGEGLSLGLNSGGIRISQGSQSLFVTGLPEDLNAFFDNTSNIQFTGPEGVSGEDAATLSLRLDDDLVSVRGEISINITPLEDSPNIIGSDGDDTIEATGEDGTLVGGTGSDILIGSTGNDVFTTDLINGDKDRNDQDVIRLGNVDGNDTGNDVITDFDVNRNNRSENNFDTLEFTFQGINHSLSSRNDILNFVAFIESDGDVNTDAIVEGNDLILIFGRDSENPDIITSSIRLVDVVGQNGLSFDRLRSNSVDELGEFQDDIFSAAGNVDIGSDVGETLEGSSENDNIIGGLGSDTLVGGGGNDTLTGDENLGDNNQFDQDIFVLGDVSAGGSGNDVITDFDTNNANGGERNFDTLDLSIGDQQFALDTGNEFLTFANLLESDGNDGTGTLIDGDDLIFVFSRNADGLITDSVRLEDIIGDDGLTDAALAAFDRIGESDGIDIFV